MPQIVVMLFVIAWSSGPSRTGPGYSDSNPAVSPNGRRVAFHSDRSGSHQIYVYDLENDTLAAVTSNEDQNYGPNWSPDGRALVWYRGNDRSFEIWRIDLETGELQQLTHFGAYAGNPSYSPDGEWIAFSSNHESEKSELYKLHLASAEIIRLTNNESRDWTPTWSPDGQSIVFASDRRFDRRFDIMTMNSDGSRIRLLADLHDNDYYPEWSPDGRTVIFFSGPSYDAFDLYRVRVDGGDVERLTDGLGAGKPSWMSSGEMIVFGIDNVHSTEIVIMNLETREIQSLIGR